MEGEGISFKRNISIAQAGNIITFLGSQSTLNTEITNSGNTQIEYTPALQNTMTKKESVGEFLAKVGAKTNSEKIVTIGKYITNEKNSETFTLSDVKNKFKSAGQSAPANWGRDVKTAILNTWIFESEEENGVYHITETGELSITNGFTEQKTNTVKKKTRNSTTKKSYLKSEIRDVVANLTLTNKSEYHNIEQKKDKILWIINAAKENGVDGITAKEICEIAKEQLRDGIKTSSITALTNISMGKANYLDKESSTGFFRILQGGISRLKSLVS